MEKNIQVLKQEFSEKNALLQNARKVLKAEFFGLDQIIDEVLDNVSSWYTLSHLQERPVVINLWGLTGTGKSSLVKRLATLLQYEELYHHFDLGVAQGSMSFQSTFNELCEAKEADPLIIALDEFQHARTKVGSGPFLEEKEDDRNRQIWELIDSGKIRYIDWGRKLWGYDDLIKRLEYLLESGVEVVNGKVTKGKKTYCQEFGLKYSAKQIIPFIAKRHYEDIIEFGGKGMKFTLIAELEELLMKMSGRETLDFMKKIMRLGAKPVTKDFSKALIFVLGNIDEAYPMSADFTAEIDADEFHELSKKISIPIMKQALTQRFRTEQIARLGNIHIIYPALNRESYTHIILKELNLMIEQLHTFLNKTIYFDMSIHDLLYTEGVYPTQGVRPLLTTIHQLLKSNFSHFIYEVLDQLDGIDTLIFSTEESKLRCSYRFEDKEVLSKEVTIPCNLAELRKNKKDDEQAITAVHESGHAILSSILLSTVPEMVLSVSSDANNAGFVYSKPKRQFITKRDLLHRVAMMLGGIVAEEIIFGTENISGGSSSDIKEATALLGRYYKQGGFGASPAYYAHHEYQDVNALHSVLEVENEIKALITEAKELARKTLLNEKTLLLAMADYLADHVSMKKGQLLSFVKRYAVNKDVVDEDVSFFRQALKAQVQQEGNQVLVLGQGICLNQDKSA